MTQKLLWLILFVSLPSGAVAQDRSWDITKLPSLKYALKCHPEDPSRCVILLDAGEKAPVPGILQTATQAAAIAVQADPAKIQKRIDEAVDYARSLSENDLMLEKQLRKTDNESWARKLKATEANYEERLSRATPSWYERPLFLVPVTAVLTLGVVAASVAVACELRGCN